MSFYLSEFISYSWQGFSYLNHHHCFIKSTLAGGWNWELEPRFKLGTLMLVAGVLTMRLNAHYHIFYICFSGINTVLYSHVSV